MNSFSVLVVDDSTVSAAAIRLAIGKGPFRYAGSVGTAAEALACCKALKPDVVTLDLNLPGGGLEMLSLIKEGCGVPVVVVSASTYEGSPVTAEAYRRGADACFNKGHVLTDVAAFLDTLRMAVMR